MAVQRRGRAGSRPQHRPAVLSMSCALMMSRRRSSKERSPPLASGWKRFTRVLYWALMAASVGPLVEAEHVERPAHGRAVARRGGSGAGPARPCPSPRRAGCRADRRSPSRASALGGRAVRRAPFGLTPMDQVGRWPIDGILLVGRDGLVRHAGEVVVGGVVDAHVVEAEAPVLPLAAPPLRRPMEARRPAARMLAGRLRAPSRGSSHDGRMRMRSKRGELRSMSRAIMSVGRMRARFWQSRIWRSASARTTPTREPDGRTR